MRKLIASALLVGLGVFAQAQQRPAITGIAYVRMYAADANASRSFYADTLGFEHKDMAGTAIYPISPSQWLEVRPMPQPTPRSKVAGVAFTTRDAAGLERYIRAQGVAITEPLHDGEFGVSDPEGNLILFVQGGAGQRAKRITSAISAHATSHRIIHAGFVVQDRAAEDKFYLGLLGFKPYWHGGQTDDRTDYVSLQVPEGTDWIEYMLNNPNPNARQLGVMNHFSLGVAHMDDAVQALARNHCAGPNCTKAQMGRDGKEQLNLFDPDFTRVEFMEFTPRQTPCCSPFTGKQPSEVEDR